MLHRNGRSKANAKALQTGRSRKAIPFLTRAGVRYVWPPSKSDRAKVASQWNEIDKLLSFKPTSFARFKNDSIYDEISEQRLRFVIDHDTIYAHSDEFDFGPSFYRDRRDLK